MHSALGLPLEYRGTNGGMDRTTYQALTTHNPSVTMCLACLGKHRQNDCSLQTLSTAQYLSWVRHCEVNHVTLQAGSQ